MDQYNVWIWITVVAILSVGVIKVIHLLYKKRTQERCTPQRATRTTRTPTTTNRTNTNKITPVVYFANDTHGSTDREYRFYYTKVFDNDFGSETWRAYIIRMPSLRGRDPDGHITHRWHDKDDNYWVCWDRPVSTLKEMQTISKIWADSVQEYIATGKRFG